MKIKVYFRTTEQAIEFYRLYDDINKIVADDTGHFELIHANGIVSVFNKNHFYEVLPNFLQVRRIQRGVFVDVDTMD